jgi:rod shape-determining protein MreD
MTKWKVVLYGILAYVGLFLDGSTGVRLNFLLVVLIVFSLREARTWAVLFGFGSGFLLDCFSPRLLGLNTLLFIATAYLLGSIGERVYTSRVHLIASIVFASSLAYLSVYMWISSWGASPSVVFPIIFESALYNTIVGIPLFYSTSKLCPKAP